MFIDFNTQAGPGSILTDMCVSLLNRTAQMQLMVEPGLLSTENHFTMVSQNGLAVTQQRKMLQESALKNLENRSIGNVDYA